MRANDLALLTEAARAAGAIAQGYFAGSNKVWDKGQDDPVSEADYAVDTMLRESLTAARPDYGWLSEETSDSTDRQRRQRLFIVDPIDGTRAFVAGEKTWAHSLAVVEDGIATVGAVYLPMLDLLYTATLEGGAHLNGAPIRASDRGALKGATLLASRPALDQLHWNGPPPEVERKFRPSLAYRLSLVAEGRYDAMLTLRDSWEWDIAAGALIASEAGAVTTDRRGKPLIFNNLHPVTSGVLAATPAIHAALLARLAA